MKKLICLALCAMMMVCGFAAGLAEDGTDVAEIEELGIRMSVPEEMSEMKGITNFYKEGIITHEPYLAAAGITYIPFSLERLMEIYEDPDSATEAEKDGINGLEYTLLGVFTTNQPVEEALKLFRFTEELVPVELGQVDGYHMYAIEIPADEMKQGYAEMAEEYPETYSMDDWEAWKADAEETRAIALEMMKAAEFFMPVDTAAPLIGQTIQFETTDLDGNPVKSEDIFSQNEITMINLWGTWCPNCVKEMADLAEIHKRLQEKGCGILGMEKEQFPIEEMADTARQILEENGCDYPNVLKVENAVIDPLINGYPTTIFVDREGKLLTFPISGAAVSKYEETVDKLLKGESVGNEVEKPAASANSEGTYRVYVYEDHNPVEGAFIQFCSAESCFLAQTDASGMAAFQQPEGEYTIHVLKVPEGYEPAQSEYKTLSTYSDVTIFLNRIE